MHGLHLSDLSQALSYPGPDDSKYTRGVTGLITGSDEYPGAAVLGVTAAAKAGAGYVRYSGSQVSSHLVLASRPEVVAHLDLASHVNSWVIGSGFPDVSPESLGQDRCQMAVALLSAFAGNRSDDCNQEDWQAAQNAVSQAYAVIDAGALSYFAFLASTRPLTEAGSLRRVVVTPHAGEAALMLSRCGYGLERHDVESSPRKYAKILSDELECVVVLKGSPTIIYDSHSSKEAVEIAGTHWLATAGTGDVLAGITGTLLAANASAMNKSDIDIQTVAAVAVFIHSMAAARSAGDRVTISNLTEGGSRSGASGHPITALDICNQEAAVIGDLLSGTASYLPDTYLPGFLQ